MSLATLSSNNNEAKKKSYMQTKTSKPTTGINCMTAGPVNAVWTAIPKYSSFMRPTMASREQYVGNNFCFLLNESWFGFDFLIT